MKRIHLLPGREKALCRRHPWIFDGAVKEKNAQIAAGETVLVCDSKDEPLAVGAWSPASQLRIRVWSFDPQEKIDKDFFRRRIAAAVDYRKTIGVLEDNSGCRLIYSEADKLPGVKYRIWLFRNLKNAGCVELDVTPLQDSSFSMEIARLSLFI